MQFAGRMRENVSAQLMCGRLFYPTSSFTPLSGGSLSLGCDALGADLLSSSANDRWSLHRNTLSSAHAGATYAKTFGVTYPYNGSEITRPSESLLACIVQVSNQYRLTLHEPMTPLIQNLVSVHPE